MPMIAHQTVTVDGRSLHCLRLGAGPALVLLHESPRSAAVLLPLALTLCDRFTVFAVDSPGYGASDPLPEGRPTIDDFADAIAASLAALGLRRFGVYGTHTGATIAAALARRHADLVSGAVLDGYPVFSAHEQDLNAYHYFPSFEARWDGGHVAALWSRVRDQYSFFPWWQPGRDSRIPRTPPPLSAHAAAVRDILSASDYAAGYNAAFRTDGRAALAGIAPPMHLICRDDDTLFPHLERLGAAAEGMAIERLGADRGRWAARIGEIFSGFANASPPAPASGGAGSATGALVALSPDILARSYDSGASGTRPLVLVPDLPGQARDWADVARRVVRDRPVIVLELPGGGLSRANASGDDLADLLLDALARYGVERFDLAGRGLGGLLAAQMAVRLPESQLLLLDPPAARADVAPPPRPEPDWHGGYMMALWYGMRDDLLFRPAWSRTGAARRSLGPGIDLGALHRRFVAAVRSEPAGDAAATALAAEAADWPERLEARASVILREGDHDNGELHQRLGAVGANVATSSYDGLADVATAMLRPDRAQA